MISLSRGKNGVVLIAAMLVITVLMVLSIVYVSRAVNEQFMSQHELKSAKLLYVTEAGGHAGLLMIDNLINNYMLNTVNATNPTTVSTQAAAYVAANNSMGFLIAYTRNGATQLLTLSGSEGVYSGSSTSFNGGTYFYRIRITAKGNPTTVATNVWDFPYYYKIQVRGTYGSQVKKFTINGDFTVQVQKDNFARYALFTNNQTMPDGSYVWFTQTTNFSGPLYSNGRFNFARNPSGTFYGLVKQVDSQARFYNNNNPVNLNSDHNGTLDVPTFNSGFTRSSPVVSMPGGTQETNMITQATGGASYGSNGIYVPTSGSSLSGGIYVRGDASIAMSVDGSNRQVYTVVQGATTKTITLDRGTNQTLVRVNAGATTTYSGLPDGVDGTGTVIYVTGNITSLGGTVQSNEQAVIATHVDTVIQNNIRYSQYTPAVGTPGSVGYVPPTADGTNNLLGIVSWAGNVRIGTSAPSNVDIHATIMAQQGIFGVDNYDTTPVRGTATVLGGVISNYYGAFGTFNSGSGAAVSGYGRNFVYDERMEDQLTPPYFPTTNTFIAFTNDINDKKFWQPGGF